MQRTETDKTFARFHTHGDPRDLAKVFDRLAPQLLLVAHHLSRNGVSAEDLVQDTFVRAIETITRFDPEQRALPWLLGILSGEAQNARRRAARVPDPHRLQHHRTSLPPEIAEAEEFRAQLTKSVDALPDTYRDVMNLRLVHGLTPTEIAHALGRAPDTVKTQLRRGRDILQAALPASFAAVMVWIVGSSESLQTIRAQIIDLAHQQFSAIHTSPQTSTEDVLARGARHALLAQPILVATVLLTGAAALWLTMEFWSDAEPPTTDYTRTELVQTGSPPVMQGDRSIAASSRKAGEKEARPEARFYGRILNPNGAPVQDERVSIFRFAPDTLTTNPTRYLPKTPTIAKLLAGSTTTDRNGHFEITGSWPESLFLVTWNRQVKLITETPTPEQPTDVGSLTREGTTGLAGRIFGANRKAASGARVRVTRLPSSFLKSYPVHELIDATHVIYKQPAQSLGQVTAFWSNILNLKAKPAEPSVLLRPPFLDQLQPLWPFIETQCDENGRFQLDGVPLGKVSIIISYPGHKTSIQGGIATDPVLTRELGSYHLEFGYSISGNIVNQQGGPLQDAELCFASSGANGSSYHFSSASFLSDKTGKFRIDGLARNTGYLAFRAKEGDRWTIQTVTSTNEYITAHQQPEYRIDLSLQGITSGPISSADIALIPGADSIELAHRGQVQSIDLSQRMHFDEEGICTIEGITSGSYSLVVHASGHAAHASTIRVDRNLSRSITVQAATSYKVTVLGDKREPVEGAEVYARGEGANGILSQITLHCGTSDENGEVIIEGLAGQRAVLTASHAAEGIGHVSTFASPDADWQVRLARPGQITGTLIDVDPKEVKDWTILMRPESSPVALAAATVFARADRSASFSYRGLDTPKYSVQAISSLDKLRYSYQLTKRILNLDPRTPIVHANPISSQRIELPVRFAAPEPETKPKPPAVPIKTEKPAPPPPDLSLKGTIRQHEGSIAAATEVQLHMRNRPQTESWRVMTNELGAFKLMEIPPGEYTLVLRGPGPGRKIQAITVPKDKRKPIQATLRSGVFINGRLDRPGRLTEIQFIHQDRLGNWLNFKPIRIKLQGDGRFAIPAILPAGIYQVTPAGATVVTAYPYTEYIRVGDLDQNELVIPRLVKRRIRPDPNQGKPKASPKKKLPVHKRPPRKLPFRRH